jgi:ATP-binding cassette subfamily F protein uup
VAFEGDGRWREYEGGVQDWLQQSQRSRAMASGPAAPAPRIERAAAPDSGSAPPSRRKLGYKEQRELESLPALIDSLEQEQATIQSELADGAVYRDDPKRAALLAERIARIEDELMAALERWESLGSL